MASAAAEQIETLSALEKQGIKFVLIASDQTKDWRDDIKAKAEQILTYALVDLTKPTHCCSIEVNFPCTDVYHRFKNWQKFEFETELFELEQVDFENEFSYVLENTSVRVVKVWTGEETEEEILDYLKGNPIELQHFPAPRV